MDREPVPPTPPPSSERRSRPRNPEAPRRWGLFEWLRPKTSAEKEPKPPTKAETARAVDTPERPKRLGGRTLDAAGVKAETTPAEVKSSRKPEVTPDATSQPATEQVLARESLIGRAVEGARNLGQGVLRLLGRTGESVREADTLRPEAKPTDIKPLARAEKRVEAALEELDEAAEGISSAPEYGGGGGNFEIPEWQLRARQEQAAAQAWLDAERQIQAETYRDEIHSRLHMVGGLAVGAALLAGVSFAHNWYRLRQMRKEHEKLETKITEQKKELTENDRRLDELERRPLPDMTQTERQAYVREVSGYATARAEEIKEVAEDVREHSALKLRPTSERRGLLTPEILPHRQQENDLERIGKTATDWLGQAGRVTGNVMAGVAGALGSVVGNASRRRETRAQNPYRVATDPVQLWLNGILLALGIILLVAIVLAIY